MIKTIADFPEEITSSIVPLLLKESPQQEILANQRQYTHEFKKRNFHIFTADDNAWIQLRLTDKAYVPELARELNCSFANIEKHEDVRGRRQYVMYKDWADTADPIDWEKWNVVIGWMWFHGYDDDSIAQVVKANAPTVKRMRSKWGYVWYTKDKVKRHTSTRECSHVEYGDVKRKRNSTSGEGDTQQAILPLPNESNHVVDEILKAPKPTPEQIAELEQAMKAASKAGFVPMVGSSTLNVRERTLKFAALVFQSHSNRSFITSEQVAYIEEELLYIPWKQLCKMVQDPFYHYMVGEAGKFNAFVALRRLDITNGLAEFGFDFSREFRLEESDK